MNIKAIVKDVLISTLYVAIGFALIRMIPGAKDLLKNYVTGA